MLLLDELLLLLGDLGRGQRGSAAPPRALLSRPRQGYSPGKLPNTSRTGTRGLQRVPGATGRAGRGWLSYA